MWALALAAAFLYRASPPLRAALEPLAGWQMRHGAAAAFLLQVVLCGVVPWAVRLVLKPLKTGRPIAKAALQALWCGAWGSAVWWFYAFQARVFGNGTDFATLLKKTLLDQFLWTPLVVSPASSAFFVWLGADFSVGATLRAVRSGFVRNVMMPNLVANWLVWLPVVAAVYSLPRPLQVAFLAFASSFWALMSLAIGERTAQLAACLARPRGGAL